MSVTCYLPLVKLYPIFPFLFNQYSTCSSLVTFTQFSTFLYSITFGTIGISKFVSLTGNFFIRFFHFIVVLFNLSITSNDLPNISFSFSVVHLTSKSLSSTGNFLSDSSFSFQIILTYLLLTFLYLILSPLYSDECAVSY